MDKEEALKRAWNNDDGLNKENWSNYWNYDKAKEHGMDKDGWIIVCGYEPGEGNVCNPMRPPQLKGIENNNHWTKVNDVSDLPTSPTYCHYLKEREGECFRGMVDRRDVGRVSHYRIIEHPKDRPIY